MNKVAKTVLISAIILIFGITVLFFVYYGVSYSSVDNTVADLVNTGNDYMSAESYQLAIDQYVQALEYEPENNDLKTAIAHAYVCLANTLSDDGQVIEAYQNALTYNSMNTNAYWGMSEVYENRGDEDSLLMTLQTGYQNTGDENMLIKANNIEIERARIKAEEEAAAAEEAERIALEESHNDLLSELLSMFAVDKPDMDGIKEKIRTDEYINMVDEVIGNNKSFYYGDRDADGRRNGKGVAVYSDGYYYYGDYADDVRSGNGIYIRAVYAESSSIGSYIFEGSWANDKPNGNGTATSSFYKDKISSAEFAKQIITGNYTDGLEDGKMSLSGTTKGGASVKYSYTSKNGVASKSSNEDSGIKGQYIIATSSDGKSNLTSDGSNRGVEGFIN